MLARATILHFSVGIIEVSIIEHLLCTLYCASFLRDETVCEMCVCLHINSQVCIFSNGIGIMVCIGSRLASLDFS